MGAIYRIKPFRQIDGRPVWCGVSADIRRRRLANAAHLLHRAHLHQRGLYCLIAQACQFSLDVGQPRYIGHAKGGLQIALGIVHLNAGNLRGVQIAVAQGYGTFGAANGRFVEG